MAEIKLEAQSRTEFGKGAARRTRRAGLVPAVLYGHGTDPIHVSLPGHETLLALRAANALLSIVIDGGNEQLALPKQVQRDPIKGFIEHVDLVIVRRGEKVTVEVPLLTVGEAQPETLVVIEHQTVTIEAEATHIPNHIEVSIEGLDAGTQITLGELTLPEGSLLHGDPEALAVNITHAPTAEQVEADLAEAEADAGIEPTLADEAEGGAAEGAAADEDAAKQ